MIVKAPETARTLDPVESALGRTPWRVRVVPEEDDDFFLDELYIDDYAYRRQQAQRPDHPEQAYIVSSS